MPTSATSDEHPSRRRGSPSCSRRSPSTTWGRAPSSSPRRRRRPTRSSGWCPPFAALPLVLLATAATIIASQAVISGAFSVTRQAIQLGLLPRLRIVHTSKEREGQIYLPLVNRWLLIGVALLVLVFETSGNLAAAYGIAVTSTMVITASMMTALLALVWNWGWLAAIAVMLPFLLLDVAFLGANLLKIPDGGWLPLAIGAGIAVLMLTWHRGTVRLAKVTRRTDLPLRKLVPLLDRRRLPRVPGTGVFLTGDRTGTPTALLHNIKHNKVLHADIVILTILFEPRPYVRSGECLTVERLSQAILHVEARFGFKESPRMRTVLAALRRSGTVIDPAQASFFLSRRTLRVGGDGGAMPLWQRRLFIALAARADTASSYFRIPPERVVEIGSTVLI